jgi:integrase
MLSDTISPNLKIKRKWHKVKCCVGLYQYVPSGVYHARIRHGGKLHRQSLETKDLAFAKRKLRDWRDRLERTDSRLGRVTLIGWLEKVYAPSLKGAPGALKAKERIIRKISRSWFDARRPMRDLKESQVVTWLNRQYGEFSESYWNSALSLIRDALQMAVRDHLIMDNCAARLKYARRKNPIRLTPTFEQFEAIVADIRAQSFNREAEDSGDFVEFLGLAGLGQAEAASIKRSDVDLEAGRIIIYRHKTDQGFVIPIYPQLRPLVEKLCQGKKHHERLFSISQARKALTNACRRLDLPIYTHRALRRMFITRAIERGVDVKVIADWQGHRDGGKLILQTYSHVRSVHSNRMAQLMSSDRPANVVPLMAQG